jgi:hypothetical protein
MDLTTKAFLGWSFVWVVTLILPPGSKAINTAYRINFLHGLVSSVMAVLALMGYVPDPVATMTTISYFIVDFVNIMINDFYFKVPSYQSPQNRKVEYAHHIFCCFVAVMCEFYYQDYCSFNSNPFVPLMFAELSTPFLIAWRYTQNNALGLVFVLVFIGARIVYQGMIFIPDCVRNCHYSVGYGFAIPYNILNLYFLFMIFRRILFKSKPKSNGGLKNDGEATAAELEKISTGKNR